MTVHGVEGKVKTKSFWRSKEKIRLITTKWSVTAVHSNIFGDKNRMRISN